MKYSYFFFSSSSSSYKNGCYMFGSNCFGNQVLFFFFVTMIRSTWNYFSFSRCYILFLQKMKKKKMVFFLFPFYFLSKFDSYCLLSIRIPIPIPIRFDWANKYIWLFHSFDSQLMNVMPLNCEFEVRFIVFFFFTLNIILNEPRFIFSYKKIPLLMLCCVALCVCFHYVSISIAIHNFQFFYWFTFSSVFATISFFFFIFFCCFGGVAKCGCLSVNSTCLCLCFV